MKARYLRANGLFVIAVWQVRAQFRLARSIERLAWYWPLGEDEKMGLGQTAAKARAVHTAAVELVKELDEFLRRNKIPRPWWKRWLEARILRLG